MRATWVAALVALAACDERLVELAPGSRDAAPDARVCIPGDTQCSNCIDDDGDGQIDGFDIECSGAADDDEATFGTAIGGDNTSITKIDCFFDGNAGSGDDGCDLHVCCLLDECPAGLPGPPYDASMCLLTQDCIDNCEPLVPPGCDCFGCCTVCDGPDCFDIYLNPALAPDCDAETLDDPVACPRCTPLAGCGRPCGGSTCVLCPGQTEADLPAACTGAACPAGGTRCTTSSDCGAEQFCAAGCCIAVIP